MITVSLRFYEELNDFLPARRRKVSFEVALPQPTTVKDLAESCGVPHTEIDLILLNGKSVAFDQPVAHGDHISIYPVFESLDITNAVRLQARPLRHLFFVADRHLGNLSKKLRLLGFDVLFDKEWTNKDLIERMINEHRVILTTDRRLLMRKIVTRGYCVRSSHPKSQVLEVIRRFDLVDAIAPFSRCVACNGPTVSIAKEEIENLLPARTKYFCHEFTRCDWCGKIYWKGSHVESLPEFIEWIKSALGDR